MAFEPQTSIAQIMQNAAGTWKSPISKLASSYMEAQQNKRANEAVQMSKDKQKREETALLLEKIGREATAISLLPPDQQQMAWDQSSTRWRSATGKDPGPYSPANLAEVMSESDQGLKLLAGERDYGRQQQEYGKPFEAIDPATGKQVFVERNQAGQNRQVEGYNAPLPSSLMDTPSNVKEWEYFSRLPTESQDQYMQMKRAQQTINLGGTYGVLNPTGQGLSQQFPVTLKPGDTPENKAAAAAATAQGGAQGDAIAAEQEARARQPRLEALVSELDKLGQTATYTEAGQAYDYGRRQLGLEPTPGAIARAEYVSKIDNEILPLLRSTFGAQFTEREGQSLKATLGDPNKSPAEKSAVLKSFIETKRAELQTKARVTAESQGQPQQQAPMQQQAPPPPGGMKFLGFE